jgi:hypothetical protein
MDKKRSKRIWRTAWMKSMELWGSKKMLIKYDGEEPEEVEEASCRCDEKYCKWLKVLRVLNIFKVETLNYTMMNLWYLHKRKTESTFK